MEADTFAGSASDMIPLMRERTAPVPVLLVRAP